MVEQPSGTVTLVFTDIEGATRLLHELGEQRYRDALAEHRRIVRAAFGHFDGYEVDYEGDAFFYAFSSQDGALEAIQEAMTGLESGPIRLRVGVHTGNPALDPPKYVGLDVHLAARVMAAGWGGQVLMTRTTREFLGRPVLDLGEHLLKDFARPVSLFQLGSDRFPPLKTISNTNLPRPASSFIGRESEVREVAALFREGARLVTLDGPGGSGKTRLAIEAASELVGSFKAGVFWVGLAGLSEPALVFAEVAQTLGAEDELARHIGERDMLLLLDNFEQVADAAPELAGLLEACSNLRVLVTSRELLRVRGEVRYEVLPLEPAAAVALFCARAQLAESPEVVELCQRLDNLPLALELAAARAAVLTPGQILERISERLDLLRGGRDANPRQQTLRATIEWSYELLVDVEQALLRRLAVFAGGCTLQAAEQVAGADLDLLQSLLDKSLLRRTGERYWMLETIREYAGEQLQTDSGYADIRRDHTSYYLFLCEAFATAHREADPDVMRLMSRCDAEQDNLRAALAWSAEADLATLIRLVMAAHHLWMGRASVEGDRWTELARARCPSEDRSLRARLLSLASNFAEDRGHLEQALALREEALAIYRGLGDEFSTAGMLRLIATILLPLGRLKEARAHQDEALELARQLGDEGALTLALVDEGICLAWEGHFSEALAVQEDVLERIRALDWHPYLLGQLTLIGTMLLHQGELAQAKDCFREILGNWAREPPQAWGTAAEELLALAAISAREGTMIQAARLLASGERGLRESGRVVWVLTPWLEEAHIETRRAVAAHIEADELAQIERDIERMSLDEAIDVALSAIAHSGRSIAAASPAPPSGTGARRYSELF